MSDQGSFSDSAKKEIFSLAYFSLTTDLICSRVLVSSSGVNFEKSWFVINFDFLSISQLN